jgi:hypothetical protein
LNRGNVRKKNQMAKRRAKAEEAVFLLKECNVPMSRVAKRLRLNLRVVKLLRSLPLFHLDDALMRKVHRVQFEKLHERARDCINAMLVNAKSPLLLRDIQAEVMSVCHLRISRPWLGKYLRKNLGVTYRRIKPIKPIQNSPSAKL